MRISRIQISNFRNFKSLDVALSEHAVIVGENKIGKTNLVYALRLLLDPTLSLKLNYRSGRRIVAASLTALGEEREYESKVKQQGTINFYECPEGITQQATFIIKEIIPVVLKQVPSLVVGKIAVLYGDRNDGSVIAAAAEAAKI
jgi:recombinational DNA repair ATPase RecF